MHEALDDNEWMNDAQWSMYEALDENEWEWGTVRSLLPKASDGIGTTTNITTSGMLDSWAPNRLDLHLKMSSTPRLWVLFRKKKIFSKLKIHHQQLLLFLIPPPPTFTTYMHNGCNSLVNQLHYQFERRGGGGTIFNWYAEHATRI